MVDDQYLFHLQNHITHIDTSIRCVAGCVQRRFSKYEFSVLLSTIPQILFRASGIEKEALSMHKVAKNAT